MNSRLKLIDELVRLKKARLSENEIDEIITNYLWARYEYKRADELNKLIDAFSNHNRERTNNDGTAT